ncbi:MAG: hypothetical protein CLLPBCKN_000325 [Chroococcidiopsis cubana SAG 39.79]|jgi:hypothetical protein|uniref:WGxxGxxG-CTERM domain-containing protein n=1 Tax=Chroococcidiopsis cubana SAG 39.79 TaxID=388085 RepID=A0AB37UFN7_9CYAN|nr:WGxxGxxG family protein [Chroococcidiopsis cubana]MDZ4870937.1 hypothetical protein [Chroococcidiopsis cubana SAG 39.79]RUT10397.1 hypothetical protein DSM107010_42850 [Chroococcidiopsis cubana SAG 39.79]
MRLSSFSKIIGISAIAVSATILPLNLPANAQIIAPEVEREDIYEDDDDGFDWGWLGLIGLFGLAGLGGKNKRREPVVERDARLGNRIEDREPTAYRDPDSMNGIGDREPTAYRDPNQSDRTGYR